MDIDFDRCLGAVTRRVEEAEHAGQPVRRVVLERGYATDPDDLWQAITDPGRLARWFLPVTGTLRPGGHYQLEGNAGGTIEHCEPPSRLDLTWEFAGGMSWLEVRIRADGDGHARLSLAHVCPVDAFWERYGPGAAGLGWDLGLLGLGLHLDGAPRPDEAELAADPAGQAFIADASADWGRAAVQAGTGSTAADLAVRRTTAFYTGQPEPDA